MGQTAPVEDKPVALFLHFVALCCAADRLGSQLPQLPICTAAFVQLAASIHCRDMLHYKTANICKLTLELRNMLLSDKWQV